MKFLSYDGLLAQIIRYIWNLFLLNICFVICCLPVVTIGAGITAAYSVFLNTSDQAGMVMRFFRAFRDNWKQATAIWLVFLGAALLLGLDWYFLIVYSFAGDGIVLILTVTLSIVWFSVASFVFPLQARYDNPPGVTMKNAVILGLSRIFSGVLMSLVTVFPVLLFFADLDVFVHVIAIWIPVGLALQMQINALIVKRVFVKVQPEEGE